MADRVKLNTSSTSEATFAEANNISSLKRAIDDDDAQHPFKKAMTLHKSPLHSRCRQIPPDVWYIILDLIDDPAMLWALRQVCQIFYDYTERLIIKGVLPRTNIIIKKPGGEHARRVFSGPHYREYISLWGCRYVRTTGDQKYIIFEQWATTGYFDWPWCNKEIVHWRFRRPCKSRLDPLIEVRVTCDIFREDTLPSKGVLVNIGLTKSAMSYWKPKWRCNWRMLFGAHFRDGDNAEILVHPIDEQDGGIEEMSARGEYTGVASQITSERNAMVSGQAQSNQEVQTASSREDRTIHEPQNASPTTLSTLTRGAVVPRAFTRGPRSLYIA